MELIPPFERRCGYGPQHGVCPIRNDRRSDRHAGASQRSTKGPGTGEKGGTHTPIWPGGGTGGRASFRGGSNIFWFKSTCNFGATFKGTTVARYKHGTVTWLGGETVWRLGWRCRYLRNKTKQCKLHEGYKLGAESEARAARLYPNTTSMLRPLGDSHVRRPDDRTHPTWATPDQVPQALQDSLHYASETGVEARCLALIYGLPEEWITLFALDVPESSN
jgi:hypothetical protein